jgi:hypothetical protein
MYDTPSRAIAAEILFAATWFFCPSKGKKMCQDDHVDRKKVRAGALPIP